MTAEHDASEKVRWVLQRSERWLRLLTENMRDIMWIMDMDLRMTWITPSLTRVRGFTLEEVQRLTLEQQLTPDSARKVRDLVTHHMTPERLADHEAEVSITDDFEFYCKDGSTLWGETVVTLLRDDDGRPAGLLGVTRDISDRKRTEQALRDNEAYLRRLVDHSPIGIIGVAVDSGITWANDAFLRTVGHTREDLQSGKLNLASMTPAEYTPLHERAQTQVRVRGAATPYEKELIRRDGSRVPVLMAWSPLDAPEGGQVCFVGDLSAQRELEQEKQALEQRLRQTQRMEAVGRLAGGVAHDYNNLLTVILSYASFLCDGLREGDPLLEDARTIMETAKRAETLTRQLLAFSRRQVLQPRVIDLNATVAEMEKILRRVIGEDIELLFSPGADPGRVLADPGQIEQVLMNLAINARDAMPEGGTLNIETADVVLDPGYAADHVAVVPGRYVMLAISDSGCGMDADTLQNAFEPFFSTKEPGRGTGLGLSTVYGIVKQSNGNIWLYSEPGQGTTVKVYLPRTDEQPAADHGGTHTDALTRGTETVLVVEDEAAVRKLAARILRGQGYTVLEARDGREALAVAEHHPGRINLLLTDVVMPGPSGRHTAEALLDRDPTLRVVYMSGYTDDAIVHHGVERGAHFIQKPFSKACLLTKLRQALDAPSAD